MEQLIRQFLIGIAILVTATTSSATTWINPDVGAWHEASNWDEGVPTLSSAVALVNQGEAEIDAPALSGRLAVGNTTYSIGSTSVTGRVTSTAPIDTSASVSVGFAHGTGTGTIQSGNGILQIHGSSLISSGESVSIGFAGGTGTDTEFFGNGSLVIDGGDLYSTAFSVGFVSGTGWAKGVGIGQATVVNGQVRALGPNIVQGHGTLRIGVAAGVGSFQGSAQGTLDLTNGDLETLYLQVGCTELGSDATGSANGRLSVSGGDVKVLDMRLGHNLIKPDSAVGLFELFGGTISGQSLTVGNHGKMVLGIEGTNAGSDYSRAIFDTAILNGTIEAQFTSGFQPAIGDVFDLMNAGNIVGNYSVAIAGLNPDHPPLTITKSDTLIQLAFVPEPSGLALLGFSSILLLQQCARRLRHSSDSSATRA